MAFTYAWDTDFGNNPEDSESRKYGAQQIRKFKDAVAERMQIDHEFGEEVIGSGTDDQADTGYHKRVTLKKVAGGPSEAASGYTELGYNSTDNTIEYYPEGGAKEVLVEKDLTQTLTNKTLTSPVITGGTLNSGSALTVDSDELNQLDGVTVGGSSVGDIPDVGPGLTAIAIGRVAANGTLGANINVTSVSKGGTGYYNVTLDVAIGSTANMIVIATPGPSTNYNITIDIDQILSTTSFRLACQTGGSFADRDFMFVVYYAA